MPQPLTDPTFYRTAAEAAAAPGEELAYVAAFDRAARKRDAMTVVDVDPSSASYGRVVGWSEVPGHGGELHHFGWNACSSALKHEGHDMEGLQRRYLLVPGLRSSDIHVFDTQPDPRNPTLIKTISGESLSRNAGYSRPHTLHCGPDGVFLTCLGGPEGNDDGPGGIALLDHKTFEVVRAWETDRGPQHFHYDAWWHLNRNVLISSEWASPSMTENGIVPELLLGQKYGHAVHFWDLAKGEHLQRVDLGAQHQMALEVRSSHDPDATWGFVGVVIHRRSVRLDLAMVSRRPRMGRREGHHNPSGTCTPRPSPSGTQAVRRGPAPHHRHRPIGGRPVLVRVVLGHRGDETVRRVRSRESQAGGIGSTWGHRRPPSASCDA